MNIGKEKKGGGKGKTILAQIHKMKILTCLTMICPSRPVVDLKYHFPRKEPELLMEVADP